MPLILAQGRQLEASLVYYSLHGEVQTSYVYTMRPCLNRKKFRVLDKSENTLTSKVHSKYINFMVCK